MTAPLRRDRFSSAHRVLLKQASPRAADAGRPRRILHRLWAHHPDLPQCQGGRTAVELQVKSRHASVHTLVRYVNSIPELASASRSRTSRQIALEISGHSPPKITGGRRAGRPCRCNGRFPYAGTIGSPAKIIASANGCTDLLLTPQADERAAAGGEHRQNPPGRSGLVRVWPISASNSASACFHSPCRAIAFVDSRPRRTRPDASEELGHGRRPLPTGRRSTPDGDQPRQAADSTVKNAGPAPLLLVQHPAHD